MTDDHNIRLNDKQALRLFTALGGYLQLGQMTDNSEFCDENMVAVEDIRRSLAMSLRGPALAAIKNLTDSHKDVLYGNGVNTDGELYDDVHEGLKLAYAILGAI